MLLKNMTPELGLSVRVDHTQELISVFRGYAETHPQHAEYYNSVISHLEVVGKEYEKKRLEVCQSLS